MTLILRVTTTTDDIANGVRCKCRDCAFGRAFCRAAAEAKIPGHSNASAGFDYLSAGDFIGDTPPEVKAYMLDFDNGRPVEPRTFAVELVRSSEMRLRLAERHNPEASLWNLQPA